MIILYGKTNNVNKNVNRIIENNNNYVINIYYPKTKIKVLDNELNNFIYNQISIFKDNINKKYLSSRSKLNIDYDYYIVNNQYINIGLKLYIYHGNEKKKEYYVETFTYDKRKKDFYNIIDLFNNSEKLLDKINNKFLEMDISLINNLGEVNYIFDKNNLIIYYINDKLYIYNIPLTEFIPT